MEPPDWTQETLDGPTLTTTTGGRKNSGTEAMGGAPLQVNQNKVNTIPPLDSIIVTLASLP